MSIPNWWKFYRYSNAKSRWIFHYNYIRLLFTSNEQRNSLISIQKIIKYHWRKKKCSSYDYAALLSERKEVMGNTNIHESMRKYMHKKKTHTQNCIRFIYFVYICTSTYLNNYMRKEFTKGHRRAKNHSKIHTYNDSHTHTYTHIRMYSM